jgi:hypothetical protein
LNLIPYSALAPSPLFASVSNCRNIDFIGCTFLYTPKLPAGASESPPPFPKLSVKVSGLPDGDVVLDNPTLEEVPGNAGQFFVTLMSPPPSNAFTGISREDHLTFTFLSTSFDDRNVDESDASPSPDVVPNDSSDTDSIASESIPSSPPNNLSPNSDLNAVTSNIYLVALNLFGKVGIATKH